jgi:hypothetical protein
MHLQDCGVLNMTNIRAGAIELQLVPDNIHAFEFCFREYYAQKYIRCGQS